MANRVWNGADDDPPANWHLQPPEYFARLAAKWPNYVKNLAAERAFPDPFCELRLARKEDRARLFLAEEAVRRLQSERRPQLTRQPVSRMELAEEIVQVLSKWAADSETKFSFSEALHSAGVDDAAVGGSDFYWRLLGYDWLARWTPAVRVRKLLGYSESQFRELKHEGRRRLEARFDSPMERRDSPRNGALLEWRLVAWLLGRRFRRSAEGIEGGRFAYELFKWLWPSDQERSVWKVFMLIACLSAESADDFSQSAGGDPRVTLNRSADE